MTLEPLLSAPVAIQIHVATVIPAALLGAYILARPKGTPVHRFLGKIWLVLMISTCVATFFIHEMNWIAGFGPIHILSVYVIIGAVRAYLSVRNHDITAHRGHVASIYFGGIVVAGLFTFLPGRLMYASVFQGDSALQAVLTAAVLLLAFAAGGRLALRQSGWLGKRAKASREAA